MSARASFDALSAFYDVYTQEDNYGTWSATLVEVLQATSWQPDGAVLDLACGTGKSTEWLLGVGASEVHGCDVSSEMLERARQKPALGEVSFFEADMSKAVAFEGREYSLVNCMDDALNFLTQPGELAATFANVHSMLAPGAAFIFDTNSLGTYRNWYAVCRTYRPNNDLLYVWEGHCGDDFDGSQLATADLSIFARGEGPGGCWHRFDSPHRQRYYSPQVVTETLKDAGFSQVRQYGLHPKGGLVETSGEAVGGKTITLATVS